MMDINKLLETIEMGFTVGYAWADKKALTARKQLEESQAALADLRAYITTQQATLEKVMQDLDTARKFPEYGMEAFETLQKERDAYREQAQVLAANYADYYLVATDDEKRDGLRKAVIAIDAIIELAGYDTP